MFKLCYPNSLFDNGMMIHVMDICDIWYLVFKFVSELVIRELVNECCEK